MFTPTLFFFPLGKAENTHDICINFPFAIFSQVNRPIVIVLRVEIFKGTGPTRELFKAPRQQSTSDINGIAWSNDINEKSKLEFPLGVFM